MLIRMGLPITRISPISGCCCGTIKPFHATWDRVPPLHSGKPARTTRPPLQPVQPGTPRFPADISPSRSYNSDRLSSRFSPESKRGFRSSSGTPSARHRFDQIRTTRPGTRRLRSHRYHRVRARGGGRFLGWSAAGISHHSGGKSLLALQVEGGIQEANPDLLSPAGPLPRHEGGPNAEGR
jgi:hypothetical protein